MSQKKYAMVLLLLGTTMAFILSIYWQFTAPTPAWTPQEIQLIRSMAIDNLPATRSLSNRYAGQPVAATIGKDLFFDKNLSRHGDLSCASCHQPDRYFTDGRVIAMGADIGKRNTPSLHGAAWSHWQFWDGRKDSLWSQALAPLENPLEHQLTRTEVVQRVLSTPTYRAQLNQLEDFPLTLLSKATLQTLPAAQPSGTLDEIAAWKQLSLETRDQVDQVFAAVGKLIAAYLATLKPLPTRFDQYARTVTQQTSGATSLLNPTELAGLKLFIGQQAQCINCHSGPLFSNQSFHNIGTGRAGVDSGRAAVIDQVRLDRFNCLGKYSDAKAEDCKELKYMQRNRHGLWGAFKTPSLRNIANTAPYFHDGSAETLTEVLQHYRDADPQNSDIQTIQLNDEATAQLLAFLQTLSHHPEETEPAD